MNIWKKDLTLLALNERYKNTIVDRINIQFIEIGNNYLIANLLIDDNLRHPFGMMHGGTSCLLAETIGSTAGNCCIDNDFFYCVGLEINITHLRQIREGRVFGKTMPYYLGRDLQTWNIEITDENKNLLSVSCLILSVLSKKNKNK